MLIVNYPFDFDLNVSLVVTVVVLFSYLLITSNLIDKEWQVWRFSQDIRGMLKCSMLTFYFILTQLYFILAVSLDGYSWYLSISYLDHVWQADNPSFSQELDGYRARSDGQFGQYQNKKYVCILITNISSIKRHARMSGCKSANIHKTMFWFEKDRKQWPSVSCCQN